MIRILLAISTFVVLSISSNHVGIDRLNLHTGRGRRDAIHVSVNVADVGKSWIVQQETKPWRKGHAFLSAVTKAKREDFYNIYDNEFIDKEKKTDKLSEWALENDLEEEVLSAINSRDTAIREHSDDWAQAVEDLPEAYRKIDDVFNDSDMSRHQQVNAMERMMDDYSEELKALLRVAFDDRRYKKF